MEPRNWLSGASATPPAAPSSPSNGYATGGVPGVSPATNPGPHWFHKIAEELRAVIVAGGITPNDGSLTQLLAAMQALFGTLLTTAGVPYGIRLGTLIVQWGTYSPDIPDTTPATVTFTTAFPTACLNVMLTPLNAFNDGNADAWVEVQAASTTGITIGAQWGGGGGGSHLAHGCNWLAIGY